MADFGYDEEDLKIPSRRAEVTKAQRIYEGW
jgi:hypothetical protein